MTVFSILLANFLGTDILILQGDDSHLKRNVKSSWATYFWLYNSDGLQNEAFKRKIHLCF